MIRYLHFFIDGLMDIFTNSTTTIPGSFYGMDDMDYYEYTLEDDFYGMGV